MEVSWGVCPGTARGELWVLHGHTPYPAPLSEQRPAKHRQGEGNAYEVLGRP